MALADRDTRLALDALAPYPLRPFIFAARTGVTEASLIGKTVVGKWRRYPQTLRIDRTGSLTGPSFLGEYANWPNEPRRVLEFVRTYGPLGQPFAADGEFNFSLQTWKRQQRDFRRRWEAEMLQGRKYVPLALYRGMK